MKRFLSDPDHGRSHNQLMYFFPENAQNNGLRSVRQESYIDMERHAEVEDTPLRHNDKMLSSVKNRTKGKDEDGKMVDVVLSDMSAPWEQTNSF